MILVFSVIMCGLLAGAGPVAANDIKLIPYPKEITRSTGALRVGPARYVTPAPSRTVEVAKASLSSYLPRSGSPITVRLGSAEEGYDNSWLTPDENSFLSNPSTSNAASVLKIASDSITVVGKGKWGMLYGAQTLNQLIRGTDAKQGIWRMNASLPCLTIKDWPDMQWRCLSPTMTWYSGYLKLEGFDQCNWTLDEWKWLVDWSLLHKVNGWALCMYGNWPFTLPGYEETTLDVDSFYYDPKTGKKTPWRFTHKNIKKEFLPELIRYANERGVKIYAYIGKNTFNGTYGVKHPDANAGGAAELIPFHPGVHEYWNAFLRRIIEIGFDGFVFEDPEANHVPNQNEMCYKTFWEPWAEKYGFKSIAETNQSDPPLGVQVEYYSWLFKTFDDLIRKNADELRRPDPEIYLISHVLLSRMVGESKTQAERDKWFAYIDEKQGRKVSFIILEADESKYVSFLGRDRVASLGGRGGSCTCAMRRIASVNNNWSNGPFGADLAYERACQKHIYEAGGFGAMAYVFEWTNTEVFGYLGSQYLWHNAGVPGIDNDNQTGFLYYAYPSYYGDEVGEMAARILDEGPCVNDAMMLEGVYGTQYPSTGAPLHRDYQLLAAIADKSVKMARKAYKAYTGENPNLLKPVYRQEDYRWNGFDPMADKLFKSERLRLLYVSTKRSQAMCEAVLAHRMAQRLIAEGAPAGEVLKYLNKALEAAKESQRIYCLNYDDDYDWTDGLCSRVVDELELIRNRFAASVSGTEKVAKSWTFDNPGDPRGWTESHDLEAPVVKDGAFFARGTGVNPIIVQTEPLLAAVNARSIVEIDISSDRDGLLRLFWATAADMEKQAKGAYPYTEERVRNAELKGGGEARVYRLSPAWNGVLANLRFDIPKDASVRINSIRIVEYPESSAASPDALKKPVPSTVRRSGDRPLFIPWEKLSDIVPKAQAAKKPGLYLVTDIGFDRRPDFFRLGVVFTVEARDAEGKWKPVFRRGLERRTTGWEHWDIPLDGVAAGSGSLKLRFTTDSYSRAQRRGAPSWKWAIWGRPQLVEVTADGRRRVRYDFVKQIAGGKMLVRLDEDGRERQFDGKGADSTGATFACISPDPIGLLKSGEARYWQIVDGFAEWASPPDHKGQYRSYLGSVDSGWVYGAENGELAWRTAPVTDKKTTAVVFVGGTGYAAGKAELWLNGEKLLSFDMSKPSNQRWEENGVEMRYIHGGDTRDKTTTYGISGIYIPVIPASKVTPGRSLDLTVKVVPGSDWFMVHEYRNIRETARQVMCPLPEEPAIAAFTPHVDGNFGVTIAEYEVGL
ncbi:MAG: glycoside hydrolase family 20 zincin-like fold domain-containing protein [Armatimonadota bacterium]|nr:glycoside hydrolase family 20 zincin-like fold domain-containing protein [Armatimonadota bacterium]